MTGPGEEVDQRLMRIARFRIKEWKEHPEYEDMLAEAYLNVWKSYCRALDRGLRYPFQIAALSASYGPLNWMDRWFGRKSRGDLRSTVEFVPLLEADHVPTAGPEEVVLNRLERAEAWERLAEGFGQCTPRQQQILYRLFVLEEGPVEVGRALGVNQAVIGKCRDRALSRCRHYTPPVRPQSLQSYSQCDRGHYLAPENLTPVKRNGQVQSMRCALCQKANVRASRARARLRRAAGQGIACGAEART